MKHSDKQKQKIISLYPFPIGYVYQNLAVYSQCEDDDVPSNKNLLWHILRNTNILLKLVGTIAICDYLANRNKFSDLEINQEILSHLENSNDQSWFKLISMLSSHVPLKKRTIPELSTLKTPLITVSSAPQDFVIKLDKNREYSWLEIMVVFISLQKMLQKGKYKLSIPKREILDYYTYLLEKAYLHCDFLQKYGMYVLISKDERKTRGFLCCGTKSKPIGIRGISNEKWHIYKGRPFLSYKQNENVPLFPFIVPWVQKLGEKTGFSDLLFFETFSKNNLFYFGYRHTKTISYQDCAANALFFLKKDLRWLQDNASGASSSTVFKNLKFDYLMENNYFRLHLIQDFYQEILFLATEGKKQFLYAFAPCGGGKTSTALALYYHEKNQSIGEIIKDYPFVQIPIFIYFFNTKPHSYCSDIDLIKSLYGQILNNVFRLPTQKIESRIQKFPHCRNTILTHFIELLHKVDREILSVEKKKMVIIIDGLEDNNYLVKSDLPKNIFVLFFCDSNNKKALSKSSHIISDNYFKPLNYEEVETIINAKLPSLSSPINIELLLEKSAGNFLFVNLFLEACHKNYLTINEDYIFSSGESLFSLLWSKLSEDHDFLAHKILTIAAITKEYIYDEMIMEMFEIDRETVYKTRYEINIFLSYQNDTYTLAHKLYRNYILKTLSNYDKKYCHSKIAAYYDCFVDGQRDTKNIDKNGLWHLAYHYKEAGQLPQVVNMIYDSLLCQEKLGYFKTSQCILSDIQTALEESFNQRLWDNILKLSFEYCKVELESVKGISQTFRYAEDRDYTSAIERARGIKNEITFFQALLSILIFAIENKDYQDTDLIFEELEKIPDHDINYVAEGLEPFVMFTLKAIASCGLLPIHTILGKHGLQDSDAIAHFFEILLKIEFSPEQLKIFIGQLIHTSMTLESEQQKFEVVIKIINILCKCSSFTENKDVWDLLTKCILSISNFDFAMESCIAISEKLNPINSINYLHNFIEDIASQIENVSEEIEIAMRSKYAILLNFVGDAEQAKYQLEKVFIVAQNNSKFQYHAYREILAAVQKINDFNNMRIYWKRLFSFAKKEITTEVQEHFLSEILVFLASAQKWQYVFELFPQISSLKVELKANTLIQISDLLKKETNANTISHWDTILEQAKYLSTNNQRVSLFENIADGLFKLEILPSDMIWKKYLSLCNLLKNIGNDDDKNKVFSYLSSLMADHGHLKNAHKIISRLSSPLHRSKPLAHIAIHQIKNNDWDGLKWSADISEIEDAFQVFAIAAKIWEKKQNKILEKKLVEAIGLKIKSGNYNNDALTQICDSLLVSKQFDSDKGIWQTTLKWINYLDEKDKKDNLLRYINKLEDVEFYENTKFLWPTIYSLLESLSNPYDKSEIYSQISIVFTKWEQIADAMRNLETAINVLFQETNTEKVLLSSAKVAHLYRQMGNEKKCSEITKKIFENHERNLWPLEKTYNFVAELYYFDLKELARDIVKEITLQNIDMGEQTPSINILANVIELCVRAGQNDLARNLFFQILPILYKDTKSTNPLTNYTIITQLLETMSNSMRVFDLWEQAEAIILNFPKVSLQEKYLEELAHLLLKLGDYSQTQKLWQKLLYDTHYIGKDIDSARCICIAGKVMLQVAPWSDFVESFEDVMQILNSLPSEYDKINVFEVAISTMLTLHDFNVKDELWQKLVYIPSNWNREECQNIAYLQLIKSFADYANSGTKRILLSEAERLVNRISKSQQICEGQLYLAQSYYKNSMPGDAQRLLEDTIKTGEILGQFYYRQILPQIVQIFMQNNDLSLAESQVYQVTEKLSQFSLLLNLAEKYQKNSDQKGQNIFDKTCGTLQQLSKEKGEYFKINIQAAKYASLHCTTKFPELINNAFDSWDNIENANYHKEAIDFIMPIILEIQDIHKKDEILQKIVNMTKNIEQNTYKVWALQKVANVLLKLQKFEMVEQILQQTTLIRETHLQILELYLKNTYKNVPWSQTLSLISPLEKEEKVHIAYYLAEILKETEDEEKLFFLLLEFPGNFQLTSFIVSKILSIAHDKRGEKHFLDWLKIALESWKINYS